MSILAQREKIMTILTSVAKPGVLQSVINQDPPIGLALGLINAQGVVIVNQAFPVNVGNYGKILDVMVRLAMIGIYKKGVMEVKITPEILSRTIEWFEHTSHGKMKKFLAILQEKQKSGVVGLIAVTMSAYDIPQQFKLTHMALPEYDKA